MIVNTIECVFDSMTPLKGKNHVDTTIIQTVQWGHFISGCYHIFRNGTCVVHCDKIWKANDKSEVTKWLLVSHKKPTSINTSIRVTCKVLFDIR